MTILAIAANSTFAEIVLKIPEDVLSRGSCLISKAILDNRQPVRDGIELRSWDEFLHPEKIEKLNSGNKEQLSEEFINSYAQCAVMFLTISDRLCPSLPVWERERLFIELLLYWNDYLTTNKTKIVLFNWLPHAGWDYVVLCVAQRLGIPILFAQQTRLNDRMLFSDNYEVEKVPEYYLEGNSKEQVIKEIGVDLFEDFRSPSLALKSRKKQNSSATKGSPLRQFFQRCVTVPFKRLIGLSKPQRHKKADGEPNRLLSMERTSGRTSSYLRKWSWEMKLVKLRKQYTKLVAKPDFDVPYVFFPMHYQPERTTMPEGGVYHDQLLAIKTIAGSISENWKIYVKEHPVQFNAGKSAVVFRTKEFYEELASIPNVKVMDPNEDNGELIQNAKFTATITGSSGWESLINGKPTVAFGIPWYSPCQSCFAVKSMEQTRQAINKIQTLDETQVELDVLKYLAYFRDRFVVGGPNERNCRESVRGYDVLVNGAASALTERINEVMSQRAVAKQA